MAKIKTLLVMFLSFAAQADPLNTLSKDHALCFEHAYSKTELNARPQQTVQTLNLKFTVEENNSPNSPQLTIGAQIKRPGGKTGKYSAQMLCEAKSEQIRCAIECDGGSATVTWNLKENTREINLNNNGFYLHGGCGDENELIWLKPTVQGDDVFHLEPVECPTN